MVIVQGVYRLDPGDRDAFVTQSEEDMRIARGERGCLEYVIAADPVDPGRAILSERWESTDDLNEHLAAFTRRRQDAAAAGTAPPSVQPVAREIAFYEATLVRQIT
jgi:quinol monooxygenase YgiN